MKDFTRKISSFFQDFTLVQCIVAHTYSPLVMMFSSKTWNKLSKADQEIFQKAALEAARYERQKIAKIIDAILVDLKSEGMAINSIENKQPFMDGMVYEDVKNFFKQDTHGDSGSSCTGSGPATVAAIGSITVPEMEKRGYSRSFSMGVAASAGALGPIIPPSIPLIIYGVVASESILKLFPVLTHEYL